MTGVGTTGEVARPEIVMEGSNDGATWYPLEFRYKPGDINRAPPLVAPHQPRLDWQARVEHAPGMLQSHCLHTPRQSATRAALCLCHHRHPSGSDAAAAVCSPWSLLRILSHP